MYDETLQTLMDKHAPRRTVQKRYLPLTPWYDADCAAAKRRTRAFERRFRRTGLLTDAQSWTKQRVLLKELYSAKQNSYWENKVRSSSGNPKKVWKALSAVLCKDKERQAASVPSGITADGFLKAFNEKVESIRAATATAPGPDFAGPACQSVLDGFQTVDATDILRLIRAAPNKTGVLDPAPTWLVKQFALELAPIVAAIFNASLRQGSFPDTQKHAVITPVLKKVNLDPHVASNYRPISNLTFLSKLLERCVHKQILHYLTQNHLVPCLQSAYRKHHSTETALLKVLSDVYAAVDHGEVTLLTLLDLSSAFDTVDHTILCDIRLESEAGRLTGSGHT